MRTLKYWVIENERDSSCYNIRSQTRKGAIKQLGTPYLVQSDYDVKSVHKVTVHYSNAFDLLDQCLCEVTIFEG